MKIKKILWASDGSKESDSALRYATFFAEKFGAEILSLFVSEIHFPITSLYPISEELIMGIVEKTEKRFESRFKRVSKRLKERGINSTYKIVRDNITQGIIETVKSNDSDLIVIGKQGQGLVERFIIGSNTAKVLRSSPVPVLAVKGRGTKNINKIENILVPVDVSDDAESPILSSLEFAESLNASVTLLYVFWLDEKAYDIPPSMVERFMKKSHQKLDRMVNLAKKKFLKGKKRNKFNISTEVIHGVSPSLAIRWYARKYKFDFIIMNTHGRTGITRFLLGSVTERVVSSAQCSVLAMRPE